MAYLSSAAAAPAQSELDRILAASRRNNTSRNVTGMLCHYDGNFLQFLEGEPDDVEAIFGVIATDPRHRGLIRLYRRETAARLFSDWSMALAKPDQVDPAQRAFCKGLRDLETAATPAHRQLVEPFLASFRAWMR
ncbi:MAG: BLUF domain-containing protein [Proteobacteria bacterium]|nr:BLUF domain-containing protein [Pseudomonadota bacterium]